MLCPFIFERSFASGNLVGVYVWRSRISFPSSIVQKSKRGKREEGKKRVKLDMLYFMPGLALEVKGTYLLLLPSIQVKKRGEEKREKGDWERFERMEDEFFSLLKRRSNAKKSLAS